MSYRPITDFWLLTRAKLKNGEKYYGAYLGGFPERARILIGVPLETPLLHACGGKSKHYLYKRGFGPNDQTADIDPLLVPDHVCDLEQEFPYRRNGSLWDGILIDPPYSEADAAKYSHGKYPNPNTLLKNAMAVLRLGGKVGMIHYVIPRCPKAAKFIAVVGIGCGFGNRLRAFSVFEKCE